MAPRQRIAWKSRLTGYEHREPWADPDPNLSRKVDAMNREQPYLHHWIETEPSWSEVDTSTEDTEIVE